MDLDIIQSTKEGEITQFLCDVRDYFKASLATSEYENTSNMFYLTASDATEQLLNRCECLIIRLNNKNQNINPNETCSPLKSIRVENNPKQNGVQRHTKLMDGPDDVSYLDMSANHYNSINAITQSPKGKSVDLNSSGDSDKTFRCSTFVVRQNKSFLHRVHDTTTTATGDAADEDAKDEDNDNQDDKIKIFKVDPQIYDICQVTTQGSDGEEDDICLEETHKAITPDSHLSLPNVDCPYTDLPAGHLAIKKSTKYGQLLRIEKRLFFDQSKKCYCGILNDWLLCYADGPTSNKPTISLYLKIPSIEIEHFGEGKRRDICFQITTCDPSKRFVFQAVNEIDAKEWIHAIETAIRSDINGTEVKGATVTRKLPTPPVMKKMTFLNSFQKGNDMISPTTSSDCIYEEPAPSHQYISNCSTAKRPELPQKHNNPLNMGNIFEYDVPKCPPLPLNYNPSNDILLINPYEHNLTNSTANTQTSESSNLTSSSPSSFTQKLSLKMEENFDFQAKVKDVHSKLTSQLTGGPNIKKSLKKTVSSSLPSDGESPINSSPTSPLNSASEMKKHKKMTTPPNSPQKTANEKSSFAKNWFLNRLNKTTSSTRSNPSSPSNSPSKCKQSEKENLLNSSSDVCDGYDSSVSSNPPVSPILKSATPNNGTSKVNMIINQLEASGHLASMFTVDAVASFSSFCDNDCNNYEPIMTVSTPPSSLMKKV